ncbi:replication restart helicase PriA [Halanaerobium praevalens]|uniref:Probable replication restart protein PriA n=1 Tax=Halanaerobium praevalens (strain ATCC 33744 / DSM 2228 / GSL) TaxID=572479 RepID=E3DQS5_HALPG|nr:primosomal protein N' [Halanaerobium praevalens]ADO76900.1 primosomal protein N' [Halanaerobium praevalens DSM 2228]
MDKVIKVVVDLPLRKLNKEFDYLLPDKLKSKIKIGQIVKVPFGRRKIAAFVTKINVKSDLEKSKLKKVDSLLYKESFFDQKLLELFYWTASYYHAYLAQVIKSALPAGITAKKIKKKKIEYLKVNSEISNFKKELSKLNQKAPKQFLILKYLLENKKKQNKLKKVLKYASTSRQTVYRLIEKKLAVLYTDTKSRQPKLDSKLETKKTVKFNLKASESKLINKIANNFYQKNSYLLRTSSNNKKRFIFVLKLIEKLLQKDKNVILLIPEIEKDYVFLEQLNDYFEDQIAFLHSKLSKGEVFDQWQLIKTHKVKLAVGARSAIFAPFAKVDAVIIMEENNENYKGQEHPLYQARQVAAKRLQSSNSTLILESPFPSLESKNHADLGEYQELRIDSVVDKRKQKVIDLKNEVEKGNLGNLSQELKKEIEKNLKQKNKMILFLNRRGTANYIICRKCGHVIKCQHCDISLSYHQKQNKLSCHYCGLEKKLPQTCPDCGSSFIAQAGLGTQKIIDELKELYSDYAIIRVDGDLKESELKKRLNDFKNNKIDILVGTSIILKNQFYNQLKFLAVISADTTLNNSNFRAAENNFFLINQLKSMLVNSEASTFLVQSYEPEHYSLKAALTSKKELFYKQEKQIRKHRNYPPFCRLLNIIISSQSEKKAENISKKLSLFLEQYQNKFLEKLGAAPAVLSKIRKKYRWQIILKFDSMRNREYIIQLIEKKFVEANNEQRVEIRIDVDPYQML